MPVEHHEAERVRADEADRDEWGAVRTTTVPAVAEGDGSDVALELVADLPAETASRVHRGCSSRFV